jgi:hypothetical protein
MSWTIDTTPPGVALVDPPNGALLGAGAWGQGCPGRAGLCGTARDSAGVTGVVLSIEDDTGRWWSGSAFDQNAESFHAAHLTAKGKSSDWSYELPEPADGRYTIHVRAADAAGNETAPSAQLASSLELDTTPPPAPAIVLGPERTTTAKSASFSFHDEEAGARFECRRDRARFKHCTSPLSYPSNSKSAHTFQVRARDAAGNLSPVASWSWTVVKIVKTKGGKPFTVTGTASGPLAPGASSPLLVTIHNPNTVAITVTSLAVEVADASSKPGCDGGANIAVTQSNVSPSEPVSVPAGGQVTLPSGAVHAPVVLMRDLSTNQDACKNASFTFLYSGSAHS